MKNRLLLSLCALVIVCAGVALVFWQGSSNASEPSETASSTSEILSTPPALSENEYVPPQPAQSDPQGFSRYLNATFHFTLLYPHTLNVREYKEKDGSFSVTFEEPTGQKGFQIYVTKYDSEQITRERFLLDSPSGVMSEPTDVIIDGVRGTMFFGRHSLMGETREVWFIRNGYLYEVATYKELDSWLGSIMATWKFAL